MIHKHKSCSDLTKFNHTAQCISIWCQILTSSVDSGDLLQLSSQLLHRVVALRSGEVRPVIFKTQSIVRKSLYHSQRKYNSTLDEIVFFCFLKLL